MSRKGFAPIFLVLIVVGILALGGIVYYTREASSLPTAGQSIQTTSSTTATPAVAPITNPALDNGSSTSRPMPQVLNKNVPTLTIGNSYNIEWKAPKEIEAVRIWLVSNDETYSQIAFVPNVEAEAVASIPGYVHGLYKWRVGELVDGYKMGERELGQYFRIMIAFSRDFNLNFSSQGVSDETSLFKINPSAPSQSFDVLGYPNYDNVGVSEIVTMTVKGAEVTDDYTHINGLSPNDIAAQATADAGRFTKKNSETYVIVDGTVTNDTFDDLFITPEDWLRVVDETNGETYLPRVWYAPPYVKQKTSVDWSDGRSSVVFVVPRNDSLSLETLNSDHATSTFPLGN